MFTCHVMLGAIVKCPELVLSQEESEKLAQAIERVNNLYDFGVIPEKAMAWVHFAMTAGTIYGPRAIAVYSRTHSPKPKLVQMPGATPAAPEFTAPTVPGEVN